MHGDHWCRPAQGVAHGGGDRRRRRRARTVEVRASAGRWRSCCRGLSRSRSGRGRSSPRAGLAICSSQQLVAAGETVVDVPATLASRVRVLGTGRSNKNDPNDALSVAIAALRAPALRSVAVADHAEVLRLLAKRNVDINVWPGSSKFRHSAYGWIVHTDEVGGSSPLPPTE